MIVDIPAKPVGNSSPFLRAVSARSEAGGATAVDGIYFVNAGSLDEKSERQPRIDAISTKDKMPNT